MKLVRGVGVNDSKNLVRWLEEDGSVGFCPYYRRWHSMLTRCYSKVYQNRFPSYVGTTVYSGWLKFSVFKAWMKTQDWGGKQLDKDILGDGRLYSPDTCCFVTPRVNSFFINLTFDYKPFKTKQGKYSAYISNPFTGKRQFIGEYNTSAEAKASYFTAKSDVAVDLSYIESDVRVQKKLLEVSKDYLRQKKRLEEIYGK